jgi:hypothetical protein
MGRLECRLPRVHDRSDESVTAARNIHQVSIAIAIVTQRFTQRGNMDFEITFFDNGVRPNSRDQFPFTDRFPWSLD